VRVGVPLAATTKFNFAMSLHVLLIKHIYFYKPFKPQQIHSPTAEPLLNVFKLAVQLVQATTSLAHYT
jgi:hypothetical protein